MPLIREYASAAKPAPGSWVMVIDLIGDFSSQANVGSAKSPGTPKLCLTPRRWRYSNRNCPSGMRGGRARVLRCRPLPLRDAFMRDLVLLTSAFGTSDYMYRPATSASVQW